MFEFWKVAAALKKQPRMGWKQQLPLRNVESVADHSFGVAALALFEGGRRHYHALNLLRLAILHDLEEAITGDLTPKDKRRRTESSLSKEKDSAIRTILDKFPASSRKRFSELWRELRRGRSPEARLVKQLDKLEMAFQAKEYEKRGVDRRKLAGFYRTASRQIEDPILKEALRRVVEDR